MKYAITGLLFIGLSFVMACSTTTASHGNTQPPTSWIQQFEGKDDQCLDFEIEFVNRGENRDSTERISHDAYLSDLLFSRLPGGELPHTVKLSTDSRARQLLVSLRGNEKSDRQYVIDCQSGWHLLKRSRSGNYLGDGVVEKQFGQLSFFRMGQDRELIVRILVNAEFNSMFVFNSHVQTQDWYRFQPIEK